MPGVELEFFPNFEILVLGVLQAEGHGGMRPSHISSKIFTGAPADPFGPAGPGGPGITCGLL